MLALTQGIVLRAVKYSESSIVATIYTRLFGLNSYIVKGVNPSSKNKGKSKHNLFQPLSLVEISVYQKPISRLQHIKDIRFAYIYKNIPSNPIKTSVFLFLHEVLYASIKEENPNEELFLFILNSLIELDNKEQNVSDFHLYFLYKLSQLLGFAPLNNFSEKQTIFNLVEGCFQKFIPKHSHFLDKDMSNCFHLFLSHINVDNSSFQISYLVRKQLLAMFLDYYRLHLTGFKQMQSHKVLEEILQ